MAKILHCSDLHLGRRPVGGVGEYSDARFTDYFSAFTHIAEYACSDKIDVMIISGDIFDKREITPEILERAERIFVTIRDAGIPVIITEGNHDRGGSESASWLDYLVHRKLAVMPAVNSDETGYHFTYEEIAGIRFYSMGYPGIYVREMAQDLAAQLDPSKNNIVLVHTAIAAGDFFPGTVEANSIDLFADKVMYIAGGHFHTYSQYPKEKPFFFVPGAPEYWDVNEGDSKYFIVLDSQTGKIEKRETRRRVKLQFSKTFQGADSRSFDDEFHAWLESAVIEKDSIVMCRFKINDALFPDSNNYERLIEERGAIKAKIAFEYADAQSRGEKMQHAVSTPVIEAERLAEKDLSPERAADIAKNYLPSLKKFQLEMDDAAREDAFALFDKMIESIRGTQ